MQTWGLTDPGNIRQQNQDSYAIVPFARDRVLMIVCDGMGGAKSGNVASSLAVEVFTGEVRRTQKAGMTPEKAAAMLRSALELANRAVYEQSQLSEDFTGMGTTLVAAFLSRDLAVIINVGDSRAYLIDRDGAMQITRDHSFVQYLVDIGKLTPEEARKSSKKNIITRAVGVDREVSVDVSVIEKKQYADKTLLLCSDGLSNYIDAPVLAPLRREHPDCADFVKTLIDEANRAGGSDNITAVAVELDKPEEEV